MAMRCVEVDEGSKPFAARQAAAQMAAALGLSAGQMAKLAIVVTEAATNLLKHAGGGRILLSPSHRRGPPGIDLLALDKGPGMADVGQCLRDGYSTAGSSGTGLGAIGRLSDHFELFSLPGLGTALYAHLAKGEGGIAAAPPAWRIGAVSLPLAGEQENGDGFGAWEGPGGMTVCVADGLGHGPLAARAARTALSTAEALAARPLGDIIEAQHRALHATRGAAVALARLEPAASRLSFAGVGNIAGVLFDTDGQRRSLVSMAGTLGHHLRTVRVFEVPLAEESLLVMHSDGLTSSWDTTPYRGLLTRHPQLIAGVLYRDFARPRDDATVVVARRGP